MNADVRPRARRSALLSLAVASSLVGLLTAAQTRPARRVSPAVLRLPQQSWPMYDVEVGGRHYKTVTYDGHVHTVYSRDAVPPVRDVVAAAERAGLDAVMITDHGSSLAVADVADYAGPTQPIVGAEMGGQFGHSVTWGFTGHPQRQAIQFDDMPELGSSVHANGGVVVLAHPGWFIEGNWVNPRYYMQPETVARGGLAETIDGIEIWNATYPAPTDILIDEWLNLLDRNLYVPITAGTDFHRFGRVQLGSPRNVALCEVDGSGAFLADKRACIFDASKAGRQYLTDGPIVDLHVGDVTYGGIVQLEQAGQVEVWVRATAWRGGRLRVRIGHMDVRSFDLEVGTERVERFTLDVSADTYVFVEVERPRREPGKPRVAAITNPVRIDVAPYVADFRGPPVTRPPRVPYEWTRSARRPRTVTRPARTP